MEISKESPVNLDDINPLKISNVRERREYYKEKTRLMHWDNFKEEAELQIDNSHLSLLYHPSDFGICSKYEKVSTIYELPLSPSIILLTQNKDTNQVSDIHLET